MSQKTIEEYGVKRGQVFNLRDEIKKHLVKIKEVVALLRAERAESHKANIPCIYFARFGRMAPVNGHGKKEKIIFEVCAFDVKGCHIKPAFVQNLMARGHVVVAWDLPSSSNLKSQRDAQVESVNDGDFVSRDMIADPELLKNFAALQAFLKDTAGVLIQSITTEGKNDSLIAEKQAAIDENERLKKDMAAMQARLNGKSDNSAKGAAK